MSLLTSKPSDSGLTVALHPLVLLTVSDHITRHQVRTLEDPVVGIILGQQKGREITAEHAFPAMVIVSVQAHDEWILSQEWMERRIQQYKDVHKEPALEVVGWYTVCPETGPTQELASIQRQMVELYNENAILVAIHPDVVASLEPNKGNEALPLSVYETVAETGQVHDESSMQVDGEDHEGLEFRKLPYAIETDETEMIAIDYIAKGAGTAVAVAVAEPERSPSPASLERAEKKGKKRADGPAEDDKQVETVKESTNPLTSEEEDQIAGITTRLNSVRMLQSRLASIHQFLASQSPSYLSDGNMTLSDSQINPEHLPYLRNIQALLTRLALLTPTTESSPDAKSASLDPLTIESQSQANDVAISSLLSLLGQDLQGMSEMGRKSATVDTGRSTRQKNKGNLGSGGFPGMAATDDYIGAHGARLG